MPYKKLATGALLGTFYIIDHIDKKVLNKIDIIITAITPNILTQCNVRQVYGKLFYAQFALPTSFSAFNPYDCAPGSSNECP